MTPTKLQRLDHSRSVKVFDFRPQQSAHFPDDRTVTINMVSAPRYKHLQVLPSMSPARKESLNLQILSELPSQVEGNLYLPALLTWKSQCSLHYLACESPLCLGHYPYFACLPPLRRDTKCILASPQSALWCKWSSMVPRCRGGGKS